MAFISQSQIFYINSTQRLTGTDSDFTVNLDFDSNHDFTHVVVLQASLPASNWLIQDNENTFQLKEGGTTVIITITSGNYNRRSLATVVTTALNNASPNHWIYSVTFSNVATQVDKGYYTFSVTGNTSQPSLIFTTFCYEALGFNINSTNVFVANNLNSTNVVKLVPENQFFIHSTLCSNHNDDILQDMYSAGVNSYSSILFQNFNIEATSKKFVSNQNNNFRIYITNELNDIIDFHGQNICISLLL